MKRKRLKKPEIDNRILSAGIGFLIGGFILLSFTDPEGKNIFSFLSVLFFVISFIVISFSLSREGL